MTSVILKGALIKQRNIEACPKLFTFIINSRDLLKWATVKRTAERRDGTQRVLIPARRKALTRFLSADNKNTIPNTIIIAFKPGQVTITPEHDVINSCGNKASMAKISFSYEDTEDSEKPALIVDGQHRLFGISDYEDEDIPIVVTALLDADTIEQAFQFIVINNKATKVKTTNVKSIIGNLDNADDTTLSERLETAGIRYGRNAPILKEVNNLEISPFVNQINWEYNLHGDKIVEVSAIEQSIKYLSKKFDFMNEDDDTIPLEMFFNIWSAIKQKYITLWNTTDFKLLKKVSMCAVNEFICDKLHDAWIFGHVDIYESDKVKEFVEGFINKINELYWTENWTSRIQDNANMRELIKEDLSQISQNIQLEKEWHEKLNLIKVEE